MTTLASALATKAVVVPLDAVEDVVGVKAGTPPIKTLATSEPVNDDLRAASPALPPTTKVSQSSTGTEPERPTRPPQSVQSSLVSALFWTAAVPPNTRLVSE